MLKIKLIGPARKAVPDWTKADTEGMQAAIMAINWEDKLAGKNGLEQWEVLKQVINEETDRCVPNKMRRVGTKPLWMHKDILRSIRKKRDHCQIGRMDLDIITASKPTRRCRSRCRQVSMMQKESLRGS